jgi:hypothetical protein
MTKATKTAQPRGLKQNPVVPGDFATDYARYRRLLGTLDAVESPKAKRHMFRKLIAMLDKLELGIWSQGEIIE